MASTRLKSRRTRGTRERSKKRKKALEEGFPVREKGGITIIFSEFPFKRKKELTQSDREEQQGILEDE